MRRQIINAPNDGIDIGPIIRNGFLQATDILRDAMMAAWFKGIDHVIETMRPRAPVRLAYEKELAEMFGKYEMTEAEIQTIQAQFGKRATETLTLNGDAMERQLSSVVADLRRRGVLGKEAIKEMQSALAKTGLGPAKTYRLEAIYRTQIQIANMQSRMEATIGDPLINEMLWGWEYVTVGDARVRPSHLEQDTTREPKDSPYWQVWMPPAGWNCRCSVIAIYKDEPEAKSTSGAVTSKPDPGFEFNPGNLKFGTSPSAAELMRRGMD